MSRWGIEIVYIWGNLPPFVAEARKKLTDAGIPFDTMDIDVDPMVTWNGRRFGPCEKERIEDFIRDYLKEKRELEEAEKEARTTLEEREARRKNCMAYAEELGRQLERILDLKKDHLSYMGKNQAQFLKEYVDPLREQLYAARDLPDFGAIKSKNHLPLLLTLPFSLVPFGAQCVRVPKDFPDERYSFDPRFAFEREILPRFMGEQSGSGSYKNSAYSKPYLLLDVDYGREMQGVVPRHVAEWLGRKNRIPLTIEESIALVTHGEREKMGQFWVCGHAAQWTDGRQMVPYWYFDQKNGPNIAVMYFDDDTVPLGWRESGATSYSVAIGKDAVLPNTVGVDGA